jgi:hypothetical protein
LVVFGPTQTVGADGPQIKLEVSLRGVVILIVPRVYAPNIGTHESCSFQALHPAETLRKCAVLRGVEDDG